MLLFAGDSHEIRPLGLEKNLYLKWVNYEKSQIHRNTDYLHFKASGSR